MNRALCRVLAALSISVLLIASTTLASGSAYAATAPATGRLAALNTNPIDWTILAEILHGKQGLVPFRIGQADMDNGALGFGYKHVQKAHAFPGMGLIQEALASGECVQQYMGRWSCSSDEVVVVYDTTVDPRSGDGKPVGLVTSYYKAPCAC